MTGGGTGGHVYPAIAIANTLKANIPDVEIAFVGTPAGIENRICRSEGYDVYHVEVKGIKRSLSLSNIKALYLAWDSPRKAKRILNEFKPDVVVGTGGYVSWPITLAAAKEGIPTLLHESNVYPGLVVRKLQRRVDRILMNFKETERYLQNADAEKLVCVGNPLRRAFETVKKEDARKKLSIPLDAKVILSYGGSRGAQKVNETIVEFMRVNHDKDIIHIHSTGDIGAADFRKKFVEYGLDKCENIRLYEYINNMPDMMAAADVIICRAGAMTVSEISMMKRAAIFIPSPNVAENHQFKNAKLLADKDAAEIIEEKDLTVELLTEKTDKILEDNEYRRKIESNVGEFANLNSNRLIYDEIIKLVNNHMNKKFS
jgi:UDP-N-acetylglucosamine--N-acetylmuramyl-(pentapeptide) pyrophosphoryl-undecaprenol N-acetylglucosamine transferase